MRAMRPEALPVGPIQVRAFDLGAICIAQIKLSEPPCPMPMLADKRIPFVITGHTVLLSSGVAFVRRGNTRAIRVMTVPPAMKAFVRIHSNTSPYVMALPGVRNSDT